LKNGVKLIPTISFAILSQEHLGWGTSLAML